MARKTSTGRLANKDDRARAAKWVEVYRLAQASPGGRHCLNPADEWECQTFIDAADPEPLLQALEGFAKHGTFVMIDEHGIAEMLMRHEMRALRIGVKKMTYEDAIAQLAEKHHTSESVIARMVRTGKSRPVNVKT